MAKPALKELVWLKMSLFTILLVMLQVATAQTQESLALSKDSVTTVPSIPLERIPIVSGETGIKVLRVSESLISSTQIEREKNRNDSLLTIIDSLLTMERTLDLQTLNNRYLLNKKNFWNGYQGKIDRQKKRLTDIIETLKEQKSSIDKELKMWNATQADIDSTVTDSTLISTIDEVIFRVDSTNQLIIDKTKEVISLLNPITRYDVEIESLLEKIDALIKQRQGKIFSKTHPSFLEIDYSSPNQWALRGPGELFLRKRDRRAFYLLQK